MGESSQKNIKIDGILWDELVRWLQTPQAKKLGFHSKAQFATQAIRELLERNMKGKDEESDKITRRLNSIDAKLHRLLRNQNSPK